MERIIKRSEYDGHIIYKRNCAYCQTEFWSRKINGKCCSNSCRNLKRLLELKKDKQNKKHTLFNDLLQLNKWEDIANY